MKPGSFANNFVAFMLLAFAAMPAWAAGGIGKVIHVTGTVVARLADGSMKVLSPNSEVRPEDVVTTEKNSVVRIKFSDGGQLTLRPETRMKIDAYHYEEAKPEEDSMLFSLLKGGLRAVTGLIGKRGNRDAYKAKTPNGAIGIRGTRYGMLLCRTDPETKLNNCAGLISGKGGAAGEPPEDGLYVDVTEGSIVLTNNAGSLVVNLGQSSHAADAETPPTLLDVNPGLQRVLPSDLAEHPGATSVLGTHSDAACQIQ
jgi:hypothetical protein